MFSSVASCQRTARGSGERPPSGSIGDGASLVHNTMDVRVGSPEATPSVNGLSRNRGLDTIAAETAFKNVRRCMGDSISEG